MKVRAVIGMLVVVAAALVMVPTASAATSLYKGTTDAGGRLIFSTGLQTDGTPEVLLTARGSGLKTKCDGYPAVPTSAFDFNPATEPATPSGQYLPVYLDENNRFAYRFTQASSGLVSYLKGKVGEKRIKGTLRMRTHLNAGLGFPDADCDTGAVGYKLKLTTP